MDRLSPRDRRALLFLAASAALALLVRFWPEQQEVVAAEVTAAQAETRLTNLRERAAQAPALEKVLETVNTELAAREKGLIEAPNLPQAQAQLLQVVRRVGRAQQPPLEFRAAEFAPASRLDAAYGVITVVVSGDAGIEQIINFLADLTSQPELLSTGDFQLLQAQNPKNKWVPFRLSVRGLVREALVPEKRETAF